MRDVRSDPKSPSLPGMLMLGIALIIGSTVRLAVEAAIRSFSGGKD